MQKRWCMLFVLIVIYIGVPVPVFSQAVNNGWLLGYTKYFEGPDIYGVAMGDFNHDGRKDVVTSSVYGLSQPRIRVWVQTAANDLGEDVLIYYGGNGLSIAAGDFNGDSRDDVVSSDSSGIAVFYQNAAGTMDPVVVFPCAYTNIVKAGDFNGDGLADVVAGAGDDIHVFIQAGGTFLPYTTIALDDVGAIAVGDLNNDNREDIAATVGGTLGNNLAVLLRDVGNTGFDPPAFYSLTGALSGGVAIGDLNNDGLKDVAVTTSSDIDIFHQVGGVLGVPEVLTPGGTIYNEVLILDVNHDGRQDLVFTYEVFLAVYLQGLGGTMGDIETYHLYGGAPLFGPASDIAAGDIDSDGFDDVAIPTGWYSSLLVYWGWDQTPAVIVKDPYRGQMYQMNDPLTIIWGFVGTFTRVNIDFSYDNGAHWQTIKSGIPNDGAVQWYSLPYIASNECLIRIYNASAGVSGISEHFGILDDGVQRIFLTYPNGLDTLVGNETYEIGWFTTGVIANVKIEYTADNGSTWTTVVNSTPNSGSYYWTVPTVPNMPNAQCRVRISDAADNSPSVESNSNFTIVEPGTETFRVISPNGGESLTGRSTYTITWESTGVITSVALSYSLDNGTTWTNIGSVSNTGSYDWTVPNVDSALCRVRVRDSVDNIPSDESDGTFTITPVIDGDSITVLKPNGGEYYFTGTTQEITWLTVGAVGDVQIQYSINNGSTWSNIVSSTPNDGSYNWPVPNTPSSQCLVRILEASDKVPWDISDGVFTIAEYGATLTITSPQGGDHWQVGSVHDIKWISGTAVSNSVKLQYSSDNQATWKTIVSSTTNDGSFSWTIPNTPSTTCNVKISDGADGSPSNISYGSFSIVTGPANPQISLNRTTLYFGYVKSTTAKTPLQTIIIDNSGIGTLKWQATIDEFDGDTDFESQWLRVSNSSGIQSGKIEVSIETRGLEVGTYDASIKFTDTNATNSPQRVNILLTVYPQLSDLDPFGFMETPAESAVVMSSIPVTGWALDDIAIDKVTLWRNPVPGESEAEVYIGDALLVEGLRPDVEVAYPTHPISYKAGWGYMLLTNFLPNGGNGTFTLHVYAKDVGGHQVKLGSRTITCDNAHAVKPFGAIDTPAQGGEASGNKYKNHGWVLTPMPNQVPTNGSTIKVYIDGQPLGNPTYNLYREDIAALFPGYANSNNAGGYFEVDTTVYENGLHTIQWVATDNAGNSDGIGSRYFTILNSGYTRQTAGMTGQPGIPAPGVPGFGQTRPGFSDLLKISLDRSSPVEVTTGYREDAKAVKMTADKEGMIFISLPQDQRVVVNLNQPGALEHSAYLVIREDLRPLPTGASLDTKKGIFYWQPGPASFGKYPLVFISKDLTGKTSKKQVTIQIVPK